MLFAEAFSDKFSVYEFGILGIVYIVSMFIAKIDFVNKDVDINWFWGYRTAFARSSSAKWKWCNDIYAKAIFIFYPIFFLIHIVVFILTLVFDWSTCWIAVSTISPILFNIPVIFFIEIYGRSKFDTQKIDPNCELIENENSKKQDIEDYWR